MTATPQDIARALVEVIEGQELDVPGGPVTVWEANTDADQAGTLTLEIGPSLSDTYQVRFVGGPS